jgi:hypothetical protein
VHSAHIGHALAQLCQGEVVLRAEQARHQRQGCSVEQAAPPAGVCGSGKPAGQPASAPHLLDKGDADAELPGELTSRGRSFVAGVGDLGTSIRGGGFHAMTLLLHCSTANWKLL